MKIEKIKKNAFIVIGKEGSTHSGEGFIQKLWDDANSHFGEIEQLVKKDENGSIKAIYLNEDFGGFAVHLVQK